MTIEEKLDHFLAASLENSRLQSEKIISDYKAELEREYDEAILNIDNKASSTLKLERDRIIKEQNHELAAKQILIKKELGEVYDHLTDSLFDEVRGMLDDFRKTDEYIELIVKNFKAAIDFAADDKEILYIDPVDSAIKETIEKRLGREVIISGYSFGGGCRTVLEGPNILIDDSFDSLLADERAKFSFGGGFNHE